MHLVAPRSQNGMVDIGVSCTKKVYGRDWVGC
jgi:hypothetical protein